MSRSYKKNPFCGDEPSKDMKRIANHITRQFFKNNPDITLNPGGYKKIFCSYNIRDYWFYSSFNAWWENEKFRYYYNLNKFPNKKIEFPNKKNCLKKWKKYYYYK